MKLRCFYVAVSLIMSFSSYLDLVAQEAGKEMKNIVSVTVISSALGNVAENEFLVFAPVNDLIEWRFFTPAGEKKFDGRCDLTLDELGNVIYSALSYRNEHSIVNETRSPLFSMIVTYSNGTVDVLPGLTVDERQMFVEREEMVRTFEEIKKSLFGKRFNTPKFWKFDEVGEGLDKQESSDKAWKPQFPERKK